MKSILDGPIAFVVLVQLDARMIPSHQDLHNGTENDTKRAGKPLC